MELGWTFTASLSHFGCTGSAFRRVRGTGLAGWLADLSSQTCACVCACAGAAAHREDAAAARRAGCGHHRDGRTGGGRGRGPRRPVRWQSGFSGGAGSWPASGVCLPAHPEFSALPAPKKKERIPSTSPRSAPAPVPLSACRAKLNTCRSLPHWAGPGWGTLHPQTHPGSLGAGSWIFGISPDRGDRKFPSWHLVSRRDTAGPPGSLFRTFDSSDLPCAWLLGCLSPGVLDGREVESGLRGPPLGPLLAFSITRPLAACWAGAPIPDEGNLGRCQCWGCCHRVHVRCWQPLSPRRGPSGSVWQLCKAWKSPRRTGSSSLFSALRVGTQPGTLGEMGGASSV